MSAPVSSFSTSAPQKSARQRIATNLSLREWSNVKMTTALLDRLTHRCYILVTGIDTSRF